MHAYCSSVVWDWPGLLHAAAALQAQAAFSCPKGTSSKNLIVLDDRLRHVATALGDNDLAQASTRSKCILPLFGPEEPRERSTW